MPVTAMPTNCSFTTDLDPIILSAPTVRSGTTLLQRLLCSSPDTLIYGETCGQDLELALQIFSAKMMMYQFNQQRFAPVMQQVLAGQVNDWILDLMPDLGDYVTALGNGAFSGLANCRDFSMQVGRPIWGVKYPGWSPQVLHLIRQLMPKAKILSIHRELSDCVKSAKASQRVTSLDEIGTFCQLWLTNTSYALSIRQEPNVLVIDYRDLVSDPTRILAQVSAFTGAQAIDSGVLKHKINTWVDPNEAGGNAEGYIAPAALTDDEQTIVDEAAAKI